MWVEVATGHPEYASELFESLTGVRQPAVPAAGRVWQILGRDSAVIGRIRPLAHGQEHSRILPVFPVPDVDACLATARQLGGSVRPAQSLGKNAIYEVGDPAGNVFAITAAQNLEDLPGDWPPGGLFAEFVTEDLSHLTTFYAPVLGVDVTVAEDPAAPVGTSQPEGGYRLLTRGQTIVAGSIESSFFLLGDAGLSWLVYLEVPNLDKAVVTAVELGCRVLVPPGTSPQGQYAVIEDPSHLPWGLGVTLKIPQASRR
jgi:predicted enzyme related to lactoylglutathione lyase